MDYKKITEDIFIKVKDAFVKQYPHAQFKAEYDEFLEAFRLAINDFELYHSKEYIRFISMLKKQYMPDYYLLDIYFVYEEFSAVSFESFEEINVNMQFDSPELFSAVSLESFEEINVNMQFDSPELLNYSKYTVVQSQIFTNPLLNLREYAKIFDSNEDELTPFHEINTNINTESRMIKNNLIGVAA